MPVEAEGNRRTASTGEAAEANGERERGRLKLRRRGQRGKAEVRGS